MIHRTPRLATLLSAGLSALAALATAPAAAQTQGVSKNQIVIATIQDLSGPVAAYGKAARNGIQLRVDEINEQGGIHGRKIKLLVEDNGYDPKRAVLAAQKLVNQDKVFLIASHIGTPMNNAAMPVMFDKGVINFMPLSAGREMFEPPHKLKFASVASYFDTMRMNVPKLYKEKNAKQACTLYQDDDYGLEVVRGAEAGLKDIGVAMGEKTTYKRGATDFSSQVARLKASNCDFLVLGTIIRETIGAIAEARKTGWNPTIIGSQAAFTDLIHKLGGKGMDGFYAVSTVFFPYLDVEQPALRFWANKYKTKFGDDPSTYSTGTYATIDIFIRAAQKAGPNLTTDSFVKAMETMGEIPPDMFGTPPLSFSPTKRLGSTLSRLSQIQNGRWKVVSDLR
ncbi:MAG: ABC transporter substrate-binding protein [Burkholderiales bacterium RIFCSPHIGHO2_12_FULL_69_20]|nr:MAG: ABC transporter substrate-binding protein [Burkholderiales bacterium RIFCSPHIGHO2_12_FULL_69_20]